MLGDNLDAVLPAERDFAFHVALMIGLGDRLGQLRPHARDFAELARGGLQHRAVRAEPLQELLAGPRPHAGNRAQAERVGHAVVSRIAGGGIGFAHRRCDYSSPPGSLPSMTSNLGASTGIRPRLACRGGETGWHAKSAAFPQIRPRPARRGGEAAFDRADATACREGTKRLPTP